MTATATPATPAKTATYSTPVDFTLPLSGSQVEMIEQPGFYTVTVTTPGLRGIFRFVKHVDTYQQALEILPLFVALASAIEAHKAAVTDDSNLIAVFSTNKAIAALRGANVWTIAPLN
jgi:hypothetical protein